MTSELPTPGVDAIEDHGWGLEQVCFISDIFSAFGWVCWPAA
jgi:hypothetical protein